MSPNTGRQTSPARVVPYDESDEGADKAATARPDDDHSSVMAARPARAQDAECHAADRRAAPRPESNPGRHHHRKTRQSSRYRAPGTLPWRRQPGDRDTVP